MLRVGGRGTVGADVAGVGGCWRLSNSNAGALETISFGDTQAVTITMKATTTAADFSGKALGVSGAIIVAAFLYSKCQ